jgi:hypothetical protein
MHLLISVGAVFDDSAGEQVGLFLKLGNNNLQARKFPWTVFPASRNTDDTGCLRAVDWNDQVKFVPV